MTAGRRAVPAYEVLANRLRTKILTHELKPGQRLPVEPELSAEYEVSRSTVREALRVLASQGLITTVRGVSGGSFVAHPSGEQISEYLQASLGLFAEFDSLGLDALLEAREMLEVPAAGLAASRWTPDELADIRATLFAPGEVDDDRGTELGRAFHSQLLVASRSPVVQAITRPVFEVLYGRLLALNPTGQSWTTMEGDHQRIFDAVANRDPAAAEAEMRGHLRRLREMYR